MVRWIVAGARDQNSPNARRAWRCLHALPHSVGYGKGESAPGAPDARSFLAAEA